MGGRQEDDTNLVFTVMPKSALRKPFWFGRKKSEDVSLPSSPASPAPSLVSLAPTKVTSSKFSPKSMLFLAKGLGVVVLGAVCVYGGYLGSEAFLEFSQSPKPSASSAEEQILPPPVSTDQTGSASGDPWLMKYFGVGECEDLEICGEAQDPDKDGLANREEKQAGTDPNNPDTDTDELADGDEKYIFQTDPLNKHTAGQEKYTDADFFRGGFDITKKDTKLSSEALRRLGELMKDFGLHEPTTTSLRGHLDKYGLKMDGRTGVTDNFASLPDGFSGDAESRLERDTQRLETVKKVGMGLYKYHQAVGKFPDSQGFEALISEIRSYIGLSTDLRDPINISPFVLTYEVREQGQDFQIGYFSETQNKQMFYGSLRAIRDNAVAQTKEADSLRMEALQDLREALLVFVAAQKAAGQAGKYPAPAGLEEALVPEFLQRLPKDPLTNNMYLYSVSSDFKTFTLKAVLENPPAGMSVYECLVDGCSVK